MNAVDNIMALADEYADAFGTTVDHCHETWHSEFVRKAAFAERDNTRQALRTAIEQALRARVPDGYVLVPVTELKQIESSLGSFCSDEGWSDSDMQTLDYVSAMLAAAPQPPQHPDDTALLRQALEMLEDNHHHIAEHERHAYVMQHLALIEALKDRLK